MVIKSPKARRRRMRAARAASQHRPRPRRRPAPIGIARPADLRGQDAYALYRRLCEATGQRQDPCVLDTFMAATDFMRGGAAAPWWTYTAARKATFGAV